jgi:membrane-associated protease RseP (regulator of RpoE activity)
MRFEKMPGMSRVAVAVCAAALLGTAAHAAQDSAAATDRSALEKQLAEARRELDAAAREVADLSRQLYGDGGDVLKFVQGGPRGSMLGINLGAGDAREEGVAVAGVSPGGPAEQAGLRAGDVIVGVDGKALKRTAERSTTAQLVEIMRGTAPGTSMKIDYLRDGRRQTASVTTAPAEPPIVRVFRERLAGLPDEALPMPGLERLLGPERGFGSLELVALTPGLGRYFGTDRGLLVVRAPESKQLPLEEGDVLQTIDGRTPDNPGHAFRILRSYQAGEKVKLGVMRERKSVVLDATMPSAGAAREGRRSVHQAARAGASASMRGPCCAATSPTICRRS